MDFHKNFFWDHGRSWTFLDPLGTNARVSDPVWYWPDPDPTSQDKPDPDPDLDPTSQDKPDPDPTSQDKPDPDPDTSVLKIFHLFYDEF